jgi:hypothetical protein
MTPLTKSVLRCCKPGILLALLLSLLLTGCGRWKDGWVHARISSSRFSKGNANVQIESLQGNHAIGMICSDQVWRKVYAKRSEITAAFTKPSNGHASLFMGGVGGAGTLCDQVPHARYLFSVDSHITVEVAIHLPVEDGDEFEIVVVKSPSEGDI